MPEFSQRSEQAEIMDDLCYDGELMDRTLYELEVINKWLGGNNVTIAGVKYLLKDQAHDNPISIADLGCGRGDMLRLIDSWARKNNRAVRLVGIDANPYIINAAKKNLKEYPHIQFQSINVLSPEFQIQKFDIVIGTLFYHHFSNGQLETIFRQLKNQAVLGIIINDIHRHPLAFYSIKILTRIFSRSSMLKFDAPLSVLRAFKKEELVRILQKAGLKVFKIHWKWAFRWQVLIHTGY